MSSYPQNERRLESQPLIQHDFSISKNKIYLLSNR